MGAEGLVFCLKFATQLLQDSWNNIVQFHPGYNNSVQQMVHLLCSVFMSEGLMGDKNC